MRNIDLTNTVDASNQLGDGKFLRFGEVQGSPKILFAGNSMAWHAPKDDIGWSGDWGMAASKRENDYVHQTMRFVREKYPNATYCIAQCAYWERNMNDDNVFDEYSNLKDFEADAVVIVLGEKQCSRSYLTTVFMGKAGCVQGDQKSGGRIKRNGYGYE